MHGNASEWIQDFYGSYTSGHVEDPKGKKTGVDRVLRGGSCHSGAFNIGSTDDEIFYGLASSDRDGSSPIGNRDFIGFRLVKQES